MTQAEFSQGWKLLILQPWGWRYRSVDREGKPSKESMLQLELYYSKLKWATTEAWQDVVSVYVEGKEWPSIQELKTSLQQINHRYIKALPAGNVPLLVPTISDAEARRILSSILGRAPSF